jgi:hypothetical protein
VVIPGAHSPGSNLVTTASEVQTVGQ